jgi:hypothetical protein
VDYDLNTGLMNVNAQSGLPQAFFAYRAITCKNVFSKGQFTQELTGALITGSTPPTAQSAAAAAPTNSANTTATGSRNSSNALTNPGYQNEAQQAADGNGTLAPTSLTPDTTASTSTQTTQPASAPGNPTSSGDIAAIQQVQANYNTSGGGFTPPADAAAAVAAANPPQQIAQDNS